MNYRTITVFIFLSIGFSSFVLGQELQSDTKNGISQMSFVLGGGFTSRDLIKTSPLRYNAAIGFGKVKEMTQWNWTLRYGQHRSANQDSTTFANKIEVEYDRDKIIYKYFTYGIFLKSGYGQYNVLPEHSAAFPVYQKRVFQAIGFDFGYQKKIGNFLIKPKIDLYISELILYYQRTVDPTLTNVQQVIWGPDFTFYPVKLAFH